MAPNIRKSILATLLLLGYTGSRVKNTRLIDVVATIPPNPGHFHNLMAVSLNFIVLTASFAAYKIYGATIKSKWTEPTYLSHSFFTGASAIFRRYAMYAYIGFRKFIVKVNGKQSWLSHPAFKARKISLFLLREYIWFLVVTISETRTPQWFRINRIYGFWSVRECSVPSRFVHVECMSKISWVKIFREFRIESVSDRFSRLSLFGQFVVDNRPGRRDRRRCRNNCDLADVRWVRIAP